MNILILNYNTMERFRVVVEWEVDASSPEQAADLAYESALEGEMYRLVFDVYDEDGNHVHSL